MGIYIDMEMPKDPVQIWIYPDGNVRVWRQDIDHDEWKKAIEVPTPHGRLIDADIVYDKIAEADHAGNYVDMDAVGMALEEVPTIIEAEDGE